jgi:hypothetical protein
MLLASVWQAFESTAEFVREPRPFGKCPESNRIAVRGHFKSELHHDNWRISKDKPYCSIARSTHAGGRKFLAPGIYSAQCSSNVANRFD